jgi:hypothetical protein
MLLSNLTASSAACSVLLSLNIPVIFDPTSAIQLYPTQSRCGTCVTPVPHPSGDPRDVPALPLLLDAFIQGAQVDPSADPATRKRKGELHFLSSVFANLSVVCSFNRQDTIHANTVSIDPNRSYLLLDSSPSQCITAK